MPVINSFLRESKVTRHVVKADFIKAGARKNDISIENVRLLKTKENTNPVLVFDFLYKAIYELLEPKDQNLGEIHIKGEIFYVDKKEVVDKVIVEWNEHKKVEESIMTKILNVALNKSQVEAIEQSHKVGLPSPIPLPMLKQKAVKGKNKVDSSAA